MLLLKWIFYTAIIILVFLIGCTDQTQIEEILSDEIICNTPYIHHGTDCCLDQNSNNICDKDEIITQVEPAVEESIHEELLFEIHPYAFILTEKDLTNDFSLFERQEITIDNIGELFDRMSVSKAENLGFEKGYAIAYKRDSDPQKLIRVTTILVDSEENADEFVKDRKEVYEQDYYSRSFEHEIKNLHYFVVETDYLGTTIGNYRFLFKEKNLVIILTIVAEQSLDKFELSDYLDALQAHINDPVEEITLPDQIIPETVSMVRKGPYDYKTTLGKATQNGVTISLENYEYEKKGDDYGKINKATFIIENNGNDYFYPEIFMSVYADSDSPTQWKSELIELDDSVEVGEYIKYTAVLETIAFNKLDEPKTIKLSVRDRFSYPPEVYATVWIEDVDFS